MHWSDVDKSILPNQRRWGQGFGDRPYTAAQLDEIAGNVAGTQQPGYGPRYVSGNSEAYLRTGAMILPPGYDATNHPNRTDVDPSIMDPDLPTVLDTSWRVSGELQGFFRSRGWRLDQHGRACMPLAGQLIGDARIGLNTGVGFGYYLGENVVVDAVAVVGDNVLLTERGIGPGALPSLPGGYAQPSYLGISTQDWLVGKRPVTVEGIFHTARRKVLAETGVFLSKEVGMEVVRGIRPVSSPHTLNFWTVTYTVRCKLAPGTGATPDIPGARWVPASELEEVMPLMRADHRRALIAAIG